MAERDIRLKRLAESRRQLTKLLVVAALIEYGLRIDDIDVGEVKKDEINEAADLARHGSLHVPKILINIKQLDRFERYVPAWSRISIETSVLDVHSRDHDRCLEANWPLRAFSYSGACFDWF